jgi:hypothetical protein
MCPEKPKGLTRTFFVFSLFLLCINLNAAGNDGEIEPLKALVSVDQDQIRENSPFILVMQINHPEPLEVKLEAPDFEGACTLDMLRSTMYIRSGTGDEAEKWTELELFITPMLAGKLQIGSFMILTPGQSIWTQPIELNVLPEESSAAPKLVWGGIKTIQQGTSGEAYLRITGLDGRQLPPESLPVHIAAPKNAIVEPLKLTGDDKHSGIVFRIRVTPLDEKTVNLGPVKFDYEKWTLAVPALSLRVLAGVKKPAALPAEIKNYPTELAASFLQADRQESRDKNERPPFPPNSAGKKSFAVLLSGDYFAGAATSAEKFWNEGNYAAALAVLRKGERDSIAGIEFAALRKQCEKTLSIPVIVNEDWRPPELFWTLGALALFFVAARLAVFIFIQKNIPHRRAGEEKPRFPRLQITAAVLVVILCGTTLAVKKINSGVSAVAHSSPYYNVPEVTDAAAGSFESGVPLRITTKSGAWFYAVAGDGEGGWLHRENVVPY